MQQTPAAALNAQKRLLQVGLNRLLAKPDFDQRLIERVTTDASLGFAVQSDSRCTVHEIESDDVLLLDLLERLHDRRQLVNLRLHCGELGSGIVFGESFVERFDE